MADKPVDPIMVEVEEAIKSLQLTHDLNESIEEILAAAEKDLNGIHLALKSGNQLTMRLANAVAVAKLFPQLITNYHPATKPDDTASEPTNPIELHEQLHENGSSVRLFLTYNDNQFVAVCTDYADDMYDAIANVYRLVIAAVEQKVALAQVEGWWENEFGEYSLADAMDWDSGATYAFGEVGLDLKYLM